MTRSVSLWLMTAGLCFGLVLLIIATLAPYSWQPSALLHIDRHVAEEEVLSQETVVLDIPGYDGQHYWQIARHWPLLWQPSRWEELRNLASGPYAYQRIVLPTVGFLLSLGQLTWLPWVLLLVNAGALLLAGALLYRQTRRSLLAFALVFCPAAMVGLHFSLAEPLTLLVLTAFLLRRQAHVSAQWIDIPLLMLLPLLREVNILFVGFVGVYALWKRDWRMVVFALLGGLAFLAWHTYIYLLFGEVPFLWSTEKSTLPLFAIAELLLGGQGYTVYSLSSIALFLGFVLPAFLWVLWRIFRCREYAFFPLGTAVFLAVMLLMPDYIWSSITSIGRVITPVYPFFLLYSAERRSPVSVTLTVSIFLLGVLTAVGLIATLHPFTLLPS